MEPAQKAVLELIEQYGGKLARTSNHFVYKFPDGKTFTLPSTPSDHRGWLNCYSDLKRLLGVQREKKQPREARAPKPGLQEKKEFLSSLPVVNGVKIQGVHEAFLSLLDEFEQEEKQHKPHRTYRAPSAHNGEVRQVPYHVLNEVNYLTKLWGEEVGQKYLQDYLDEQNFGPRGTFKKKETPQGEQNENMPEPLELALQNAKQNLANLEEEALQLERKAEECKQMATKRREQKGAIQEAIASLEMTVEAFKKAGPALRNILPSTPGIGGKRRSPARSVRPNLQNELLQEAVKLYGDQPFLASDMWKQLTARPEWTDLAKSSVYSALAQHCKNTPKRPAKLKRVGEAQYQFVTPVTATSTAA